METEDGPVEMPIPNGVIADALDDYDQAVTLEDMAEAAENVMELVMGKFFGDGLDSIWYGRIVDRVNQGSVTSSMRMADQATFYGLARLINDWAESGMPASVRIADGG